ncbi:hypothetical protein F8M41_017204 [Gigaspora margarita]|uniref:Uncharacterized protein n=1 Tax=Gigaspora margarita TaxID=4874 RepID=A0A8H4B336_GIGMA|nr:hypothetical protein F8M41_017204 [Gigaspora margarita]
MTGSFQCRRRKSGWRYGADNHQPPNKQERPHDIPKGKRALVLLFFHRLGASSSTTALGLLGAFSLEAWLRGLPLCYFRTWSRF